MSQPEIKLSLRTAIAQLDFMPVLISSDMYWPAQVCSSHSCIKEKQFPFFSFFFFNKSLLSSLTPDLIAIKNI